jgi:hypothetical protein
MLQAIRNWLRPSNKLIIEEPPLGELTYHADMEMWEGQFRCVGMADPVDLLVTAPRTGPTQQQLRWLTVFGQHHQLVLNEIRGLLDEGSDKGDWKLIVVDMGLDPIIDGVELGYENLGTSDTKYIILDEAKRLEEAST